MVTKNYGGMRLVTVDEGVDTGVSPAKTFLCENKMCPQEFRASGAFERLKLWGFKLPNDLIQS